MQASVQCSLPAQLPEHKSCLLRAVMLKVVASSLPNAHPVSACVCMGSARHASIRPVDARFGPAPAASGPIHTAALVQEVRPGETTLKVSLRSCDGFDTTPITTAFGGGGHAAAGSCMMAEGQFQAWRCATQGA